MTTIDERVREVDPFTVAHGGRYDDDVVTVVRGGAVDVADRETSVSTEHFRLDWSGSRPRLRHRIDARRIDNDLAGLLAEELFAPGWLCGGDVYERLLTGLVLTSAADPLSAWELFYRNTLRRLEFATAKSPTQPTGHGTLDGFAPVYRRAIDLAGHGSVLEIGSCFGFLSLQLARRGQLVTASDVSAGTMRLLSAVAPRLGVDVGAVVCDAAHVPLPDSCVDVVQVVHLLEHLEPEHGTAVVAEALRLARHRVVVAVPFEDEPSAAFGHVRTVTLADLHGLAGAYTAGAGWTAAVDDHHGGWLVLDRRF